MNNFSRSGLIIFIVYLIYIFCPNIIFGQTEDLKFYYGIEGTQYNASSNTNDSVAQSQNASSSIERDPSLRLYYGIGLSIGDIPFYSVFGVVSYQTGLQIISLRYISNTGFGVEVPPYPTPSCSDAGLLYGIALAHGTGGLIALNVGIDYVSKYWPVAYSPVNGKVLYPADTNTAISTHAFGLAYQMQFMWNITNGFGLGMIFYGETNNIYSHGGILLSFEVGWF